MKKRKKVKHFLPLLILITILNFVWSCSSKIEVPSNESKERAVEVIKEEKTDIEITTKEEKEEKKPTLKITSVVGIDNDNNTYSLTNNTISGNINLIEVLFKAENFDISKDRIESIWEFEEREVHRSEEVLKETGNTYLVGVSMTEGFFLSGKYKCIVSLNNSKVDSIEFKVAQSDLEVIEISGSGVTSTEFFNIAGGLTILEFSNIGSGNFIVYLLDEEGNELELLVNEIGSISGRKAMYLPNGKYFLNIEHGDNWKYIIKQPRSLETKTMPYMFKGDSPDVSDLVLLDGLVEINYKFSGSGNFIVYLLNEYGEGVELLVNEIGKTSGTIGFKGNVNKYLIGVESADGNYEIRLDYK